MGASCFPARRRPAAAGRPGPGPAAPAEARTPGPFALAIDSPRPDLALIARVATWRSRLTGVPYGDQAIFLSADLFRALGGYREIPIMEDLDLMRRVRRAGGRTRLLSAAVPGLGPALGGRGRLARCTLRNWTLATLFLLGVPPGRLAGWYRPVTARGPAR